MPIPPYPSVPALANRGGNNLCTRGCQSQILKSRSHSRVPDLGHDSVELYLMQDVMSFTGLDAQVKLFWRLHWQT